jgi:lysozyme family protein
MVASNFQASLKLVLQSEGGNDDDPADHGGRTSRGITQREYDAWRNENNLPPLDVWQAPQTDIDTIYHNEYWNPYCDVLPLGVDYLFFNNSVLDGPHRATVILQQALGVTADGRMGPITRQAAMNAVATTTIVKASAFSIDFYKGLHQPRFLKGWLNRVSFVEKNALSMLSITGVVA